VSGVPEPNHDHAGEIARLAIHFSKAISKIRIRSHPDVELKLKIGIHSGPVVAGLVGKKSSRYCLFGDTGMLHLFFSTMHYAPYRFYVYQSLTLCSVPTCTTFSQFI
jgi:hypothetical protein